MNSVNSVKADTGCVNCANERNGIRLFYFITGFVLGMIALYVLFTFTAPIPRAQLLSNDCPRIADGSRWCAGGQ